MNGKIVILGAGHVGSHVASALARDGVGSEIVLTDIVPGKAEAQAMDIADSFVFSPGGPSVRAGTPADCADADVTVVAIGKPREPGQTRLDLLHDSVLMAVELSRQMPKAGPDGCVISITNPCDIIADCLRKLLHMDRRRLFGTGTLLDTARLLRTLSRQTGTPADRIRAVVLGEHGDSSMIPFSCVTVDGAAARNVPQIDREAALERTHMIGMDIIQGKGSTEFGIGRCAAYLIGNILEDTGAVLPLSVLLQGEYGLTGLHMGVPCEIGCGGVRRIVELPLTNDEKAALQRSAQVILKHIRLADDIVAGL